MAGMPPPPPAARSAGPRRPTAAARRPAAAPALLLGALAAALAAPGAVASQRAQCAQKHRGSALLAAAAKAKPREAAKAGAANAAVSAAARGLHGGFSGLLAGLAAEGSRRGGFCEEGASCLMNASGSCGNSHACFLQHSVGVCACRPAVDKCDSSQFPVLQAGMQAVLELSCGECGSAAMQLYKNGCYSDPDAEHFTTDCNSTACLPLLCSGLTACPTVEQILKKYPGTEDQVNNFRRLENEATETLNKCHHSCQGPPDADAEAAKKKATPSSSAPARARRWPVPLLLTFQAAATAAAAAAAAHA